MRTLSLALVLLALAPGARAEESPLAETRRTLDDVAGAAFTPDGKALVTGHDNHLCLVTPLANP